MDPQRKGHAGTPKPPHPTPHHYHPNPLPCKVNSQLPNPADLLVLRPMLSIRSRGQHTHRPLPLQPCGEGTQGTGGEDPEAWATAPQPGPRRGPHSSTVARPACRRRPSSRINPAQPIRIRSENANKNAGTDLLEWHPAAGGPSCRRPPLWQARNGCCHPVPRWLHPIRPCLLSVQEKTRGVLLPNVYRVGSFLRSLHPATLPPVAPPRTPCPQCGPSGFERGKTGGGRRLPRTCLPHQRIPRPASFSGVIDGPQRIPAPCLFCEAFSWRAALARCTRQACRSRALGQPAQRQPCDPMHVRGLTLTHQSGPPDAFRTRQRSWELAWEITPFADGGQRGCRPISGPARQAITAACCCGQAQRHQRRCMLLLQTSTGTCRALALGGASRCWQGPVVDSESGRPHSLRTLHLGSAAPVQTRWSLTARRYRMSPSALRDLLRSACMAWGQWGVLGRSPSRVRRGSCGVVTSLPLGNRWLAITQKEICLHRVHTKHSPSISGTFFFTFGAGLKGSSGLAFAIRARVEPIRHCAARIHRKLPSHRQHTRPIYGSTLPGAMPAANPAGVRPLDVVIWGATGYTGAHGTWGPCAPPARPGS